MLVSPYILHLSMLEYEKQGIYGFGGIRDRFDLINPPNYFLLSHQTQMNMHDNFDPNEFLIGNVVKQATNQPTDMSERGFDGYINSRIIPFHSTIFGVIFPKNIVNPIT